MSTPTPSPATDRIPAATLSSRIPQDRLYRLSRPFVEYAQGVPDLHHGLRLLHGLVHATCRETSVWHKPTERPPEASLIPCQDLRRNLGLKSLDNRCLKTGLDELARAGMFDVLEFRNDGHWLAWRFTEAAYHWLFAEPGHGYGYFDIADVRSLRTRTDLVVHAQLGARYAQFQPEFCMQLGLLQSWERERRSIVRALQRSVALHRCGLLVLLEGHGSRIGIDMVIVRMWLPHTRWGKNLLKRTTPHARRHRMLLVDGTRLEEVRGHADPETVAAFFKGCRATAA